MKKITALLLTCSMLFVAACGASGNSNSGANTNQAESSEQKEEAQTNAPADEAQPEQEETQAPEAKEVMGITIPEFAINVGGKVVTNTEMADFAVYEVQTHTVNSSGTESNVKYVGFTVSDLLKAAGIESFTNLTATADDGYAIDFTSDVALEDTTLIAISADGQGFKSSPWFAPCSSGTSGEYLKGLVAISFDGAAADTNLSAEGEEGDKELALSDTLPEILDRTDKVTFGDYSFKVNGKEITNATLEGLSIYKITVVTSGKDNALTEATYTGYRLSDVLEAAGVTSYTTVKAVANDGYESKLSAELAGSEYTLLAIEKDKETGEDGTVWVAPCAEQASNAYCKLVVDVLAE